MNAFLGARPYAFVFAWLAAPMMTVEVTDQSIYLTLSNHAVDRRAQQWRLQGVGDAAGQRDDAEERAG